MKKFLNFSLTLFYEHLKFYKCDALASLGWFISPLFWSPFFLNSSLCNLILWGWLRNTETELFTGLSSILIQFYERDAKVRAQFACWEFRTGESRCAPTWLRVLPRTMNRRHSGSREVTFMTIPVLAGWLRKLSHHTEAVVSGSDHTWREKEGEKERE